MTEMLQADYIDKYDDVQVQIHQTGQDDDCSVVRTRR